MLSTMRRGLACLAILLVASTACGSDEPVAESPAPIDTVESDETTEAPAAAEVPSGPASVAAADQASDGTVVVAETVVLPAPGFLTVHADDGGGPGPIIGHNPVLLPAGESVNVEVELYEALGESSTIWFMPHVDMDGDGEYTFVPPDNLVDGPALTAGGDVAIAAVDIEVG